MPSHRSMKAVAWRSPKPRRGRMQTKQTGHPFWAASSIQKITGCPPERVGSWRKLADEGSAPSLIRFLLSIYFAPFIQRSILCFVSE